jgi:predicted transcriptional regulator
MASATVRIRPETHERLRQLAEQRDVPMQDVLDAAVERLWRESLLAALNEDYEALRADPERWREELEERALWDAASGSDTE